jgi:N-acetylmuramoyl-L-alanine amidase
LPDVPTVLCEPFFGNNPDDASRAAAIGTQGLALAYLRALRSYAVAQRGDRVAQELRRARAG